MRINYNNFVTIFYIKIKNGRKIIINYNIGIRIKFCILSLLKKICNNKNEIKLLGIFYK